MNASKARSARQWKIWERSGAVGTIDGPLRDQPWVVASGPLKGAIVDRTTIMPDGKHAHPAHPFALKDPHTPVPAHILARIRDEKAHPRQTRRDETEVHLAIAAKNAACGDTKGVHAFVETFKLIGVSERGKKCPECERLLPELEATGETKRAPPFPGKK